MLKNAKLENTLNFILGLWCFFVPWVVSHNTINSSIISIASWNMWIVGAIVVVTAGLAVQDIRPWEEWVNLVLGIWLFSAPWVMGYSQERALMWNSMVVGVCIAILSGFALPAAERAQEQRG